MKLIDKAAVVAEIEKLQMNHECVFNEYDAGFSEGRCSAFDEVLSFLDILEVVKEADLDKEIDEHWDEWAKEDGFHSIDFARYFFKLGLKAKR